MCGNPRKVFGEPTLQEKKYAYDPMKELDYMDD
jgi:hypothetical protein